MKIVDTHCHLDFDIYDQDREDVINRARENGVCGFVIPAVRRNTWESLIATCEQSSDLYYALGLHPMFIKSHEFEHIQKLRDYLRDYQPIAVGEIGLDHYDGSLQIEKQYKIFEQQLRIACDVNLPVILHVRKAHEEVLGCLKKYPVIGGIVHAFNGSLQQADRYQQHNFKFGFGGMLTYERSSKLRKLAAQLPLESIVLETDSPDMTVEQHQGERNSPEYLPHCLESLAEVRAMSVQKIALQTSQNACDVLKFKF